MERTMKGYEYIAEAFVAEGVGAMFVLMGDGNMHMTSVLDARGVRCIHVRHEHTACSAAMSYAMARNEVGVAAVTHGPGFTQIMTALVGAVHARIPLVVFAGETPLSANWSNQHVDQAVFATAAGAAYISAHQPETIPEAIYRAFSTARDERRPVVLAVPSNVQMKLVDFPEYVAAGKQRPVVRALAPDPEVVSEVAGMLARARKPIILAGRGAILGDGLRELQELADRSGALLTTTLLAKGCFEDHAFCLGVMGGYGSVLLRELAEECDLLIAAGASLATYTIGHGKLLPNASVVQIDLQPRGHDQGQRPADLRVSADVKLAAAAISDAFERLGAGPREWRSDSLAQKIASSRAAVDPAPVELGVMDPNHVIDVAGGVIPSEWEVVVGAGHCAYFPSRLRNREPGRYTTIRHFGAVGNGLAYAIGVAVARPESDVVLFEGDGGLLMHVQELETIRRHGLKILVCVLNDGGYGSEIHVLRAAGIDPSIASFGYEDFARVAQGFGLAGHNISDLKELPALLQAYEAGSSSTVWNFPISDKITSPVRGQKRSH